MAVDLPAPVGPNSTVCNSASLGSTPTGAVGPGPLVRAKTRPRSRWTEASSHAGGAMRRGETGGSPGRSPSPIGQPSKQAISLADRRNG